VIQYNETVTTKSLTDTIGKAAECTCTAWNV